MEKKRLVIGVLAHVDAGKTTLAEGILYLTGSIRKLGRVDHQDAFLDNFELERSRGITIFSKQAELMLEDVPVTLVDTPGHVDFSAEMERTLQILDYAVLVISGADGVQGHVETLWKLLKRYEIPVFLFINKMDQPGTDRKKQMEELTGRLDSRCIDFSSGADTEDFLENLAMCDETLLEQYLECGEITEEEISALIAGRSVFPCYFGSALKLEGVDALLEGIRRYSRNICYPEQFGARVYKISRDAQGNRLTHLKITGGTLKVKDLLTNRKKENPADGRASGEMTGVIRENEIWEEKVNQIRIYSGGSYRTVPEAEAGMVCAVTGLEKTYAGEGLGGECEAEIPVLEPVLSYQICLPEECDVYRTFLKLRQLEEEEPQLHIVWDEQLGEIHAQLMGEVQIEVLKNIILQRFGIRVEFGAGNIVYKETLRDVVEGVGHFEPLRHYAEVHLLLEPGERGSGMQFFADCSEDMLDRNWQRLILTHLEEKKHRGVLTGSEITDLRITLVAGRAHQKHTEGGDFRQATYRAVRQGLRCGESILLEPVYRFSMEIPAENVGRAMTDIQKMSGSFAPPVMAGDTAVITGSAPVVTMRGYQTELLAYTKGRGRLSCVLKGYEECHNAEEVIAEKGYDPEADQDNPTGSVFCAHGAGFVVNWDQVPRYMHLESIRKEEPVKTAAIHAAEKRTGSSGSGGFVDEKELEEIFARTYGSSGRERSRYTKSRRVEAPVRTRPAGKEELEEYLLVDGYNIIFAWDELKEMAKDNLAGARTKLMDILCNYQGYKKVNLILVFDAYRVEGNRGEVQKYHNIYVVYTKEAETADQYIEKTVHEIGRKYHVTVATSDALEQVIILAEGATRMSANGLREELELTSREIREAYLGPAKGGKNYLFDRLPEELSDLMEDVRLGKKQLNTTETKGNNADGRN
ncbi:MAG: translation factor GTPase family protein [Candidatus Choladocola sp.]|nr:translation factor GTPase family protein [Candidatus Choladocola sp.]